MKVAFIVTVFPVVSQTFILNQITGLLDKGCDLEIFAQYNPKESKIHPSVEAYRLMERVTYFNIPENGFMYILKAIFLIIFNFYKDPAKILKSLNISKYGGLKFLYVLIPFLGKKFDIIHCHFGPNGIMGAYLKSLGTPGKYVTSFHGHDVNSYPRLKGTNVYNKLFKCGDCFTANSNFTKDQLIKLGCNEKKIIILHTGFRIEKFKFSIKNTPSQKPVKLLSVARLVEKKGHEYTIKAVAKVLVKHKNILYLVAGDGPLRNKLEALASELKLKKCAKFLGIVNQDEVLKLYEEANIFILPSVTASDGDQEGQGLVLQEAQAAGLPVISTLHNGIPEGVLNGKSGFLVGEKDVDALAERIEYLIEHPEIWPEMGKAGRQFVEEKYDIKKLNKKLIEIYKGLLNDGYR